MQTNGITAESNANGVLTNMIPKEGGNTFRGTSTACIPTNNLQASTVSDELRSRGLTGGQDRVHLSGGLYVGRSDQTGQAVVLRRASGGRAYLRGGRRQLLEQDPRDAVLHARFVAADEPQRMGREYDGDG